jgi:hypothetical protein
MAHNLSREAERYLARAEQALEAAQTLNMATSRRAVQSVLCHVLCSQRRA